MTNPRDVVKDVTLRHHLLQARLRHPLRVKKSVKRRNVKSDANHQKWSIKLALMVV
jgi:hypothetical protein